MIAFPAKSERRGQPDAWQQLRVLGDEFRQDLIPGLNRDHMGQPHDPFLRLVPVSFNAFYQVDVKELRVNGPLIQAKMKVFHSSFRMSSLIPP